MTRLTIIFILTFYSLTILSQTDSTVYNLYKATKNVTEIKYVKNYYSSGQIKSEGWMVYEKSSPNSEIVQVKKWDKYEIIEHKFGLWKRYHKQGQIAGIDSNGVLINQSSRQYDYNEKGCLTKIVVMKPLVTIDKVSKRWVVGDMGDIASLDFYYYNCSGITNEEHFLTNYVKSGTWKWYKNGKVTKTKEFKQ